MQARIFSELLSRDHADGRATRSAGACAACRATRPAAPRCWFPYLNGTSQGPTPEDARKDGHIRGRSHARAWIHEISGLGFCGVHSRSAVFIFPSILFTSAAKWGLSVWGQQAGPWDCRSGVKSHVAALYVTEWMKVVIRNDSNGMHLSDLSQFYVCLY